MNKVYITYRVEWEYTFCGDFECFHDLQSAMDFVNKLKADKNVMEVRMHTIMAETIFTREEKEW